MRQKFRIRQLEKRSVLLQSSQPYVLDAKLILYRVGLGLECCFGVEH